MEDGVQVTSRTIRMGGNVVWPIECTLNIHEVDVDDLMVSDRENYGRLIR